MAPNSIKKKLQYMCFPANIMKFLRTSLFYRTRLVAILALCTLSFCAIFGQADEDKIV